MNVIVGIFLDLILELLRWLDKLGVGCFCFAISRHGHDSLLIFEFLPLVFVKGAIVDISGHNIVKVYDLLDLLRVIIEVINEIIWIFTIILMTVFVHTFIKFRSLLLKNTIFSVNFFTLKNDALLTSQFLNRLYRFGKGLVWNDWYRFWIDLVNLLDDRLDFKWLYDFLLLNGINFFFPANKNFWGLRVNDAVTHDLVWVALDVDRHKLLLVHLPLQVVWFINNLHWLWDNYFV